MIRDSEIDADNAEGVGDEKGFAVGRQGDSVGIEKFAVDLEWREGFPGRVEAEDFVVEAVGKNDFAGFANDQVVEAVFCLVVERKTAEKISGCVKVNEFGFAEVIFGVGPDGGICVGRDECRGREEDDRDWRGRNRRRGCLE